MRHDWIHAVLCDLRSYALENDLPDLAVRIEAALVALPEAAGLPPSDRTEAEPAADGSRHWPPRPH